MAALLSISAFAAVNTEYRSSTVPKIKVSMTQQTPDPVEPGKIVEVTFKIDNEGAPAHDFIFEIMPQYPFGLPQGEGAQKQLGIISSSQETDRSVIVKYKLAVAPDAPDGGHTLKVRYKSKSENGWTALDDDFSIIVRSMQAILGVSRITSTPMEISPGERAKLSVEIKNFATLALRDIKVTLDIGSGTRSDMPFNPVSSSNILVLPLLSSQATQTLDFNLLVDADAASKAYRVPIKLSYTDAANRNQTTAQYATLIVSAKPVIDAVLERTDLYTANKAGTVVVRIVNKGTEDVKFVNVELQKREDYEIIGPRESYIGELDSDDFSTVEFKLFAKSKKNMVLPLRITYADSHNRQYDATKEVSIQLYDQKQAQEFGLVKNNTGGMVAVVVLIIVAGYFVYRRLRKKRKP